MDIMTAAAICLKLTERKKISPLTAQETQELESAQAFVQGWAKGAATNVKVFDPLGLLPNKRS